MRPIRGGRPGLATTATMPTASKRLSEQGEDGKVVESKTYEKADLIASAGAFSDSEFEKEAGKHTWSRGGIKFELLLFQNCLAQMKAITMSIIPHREGADFQ